MGCLCTILGRDDVAEGQAWANDVCPKCGKAFEVDDRVVVDEDNDTVYHYDCYEGPKPPFEEGVASQG